MQCFVVVVNTLVGHSLRVLDGGGRRPRIDAVESATWYPGLLVLPVLHYEDLRCETWLRVARGHHIIELKERLRISGSKDEACKV